MHAGLPAALHRPHLFQVRGRNPLECTGNRRNTTNVWYHIRSNFHAPSFLLDYRMMAVLMSLSLGLSSMATGSLEWMSVALVLQPDWMED